MRHSNPVCLMWNKLTNRSRLTSTEIPPLLGLCDVEYNTVTVCLLWTGVVKPVCMTETMEQEQSVYSESLAAGSF